VEGVAGATPSGLPFTQLPLCKLDADTTDPVAFGTIAYFDPALPGCPDGWTPVDEANGRVLVPGYKENSLIPSVGRCGTCAVGSVWRRYF
jgi:hypothetical protein